jgi:hypothetical protein
MGKIYCIYTDKFIEEENCNPEHIIPLSLGGCNEFVIKVDSQKNSELGAALDGKLANDFLINLIRQKHNYRGHTKNPVVKTIKNSKIKGTSNIEIPAQVTFLDGRIEVFNPIERRVLTEDEVRGLSLISTFRFDRFLRLCFTAKVILSAGYYVYGETFIKYADHVSLRKLMNLNLTETKESLRNLPLRVVDKFHYIPEDSKGTLGIHELICTTIGNSCVIFMLSTENIIASVGIGGDFIGSINFKADAAKFPNEELFRLGQVIAIQNNEVNRESFYNVIAKINEMIN